MPCAKSSQISLGLHHRQVQCWRLSWFLHKQVHIFYQSFWDWIVSELLSQKALSICQMHWWLRWGECKAYANCYMDGGYGDGEIEMSCSINIWFDSDGCLKIIVNNVISRALLSFSFVMITGPCADGYGVCCLNFVTACQSNVKKNVSYIQVNSTILMTQPSPPSPPSPPWPWTLLSEPRLSSWLLNHNQHMWLLCSKVRRFCLSGAQNHPHHPNIRRNHYGVIFDIIGASWLWEPTLNLSSDLFGPHHPRGLEHRAVGHLLHGHPQHGALSTKSSSHGLTHLHPQQLCHHQRDHLQPDHQPHGQHQHHCQPAQPGRLLWRYFWSNVRPWDGFSAHLYWYRQRSRRLSHPQVIIRTCRPFTLLDHPDHFEWCTAKIQYKYHDEINDVFYEGKVECNVTRFGINTANSVAAGVSSTADRTWSIRVTQVVKSVACIDNEICPIAKTNIQRKLWWW